MTRFVAVTAVRDFEGRVRQAISGALHGDLQTLSPEVLQGSTDDVFKQLTGAPPEVMILGPGVNPDDALKLATVFDLQYPEISLLLVSVTDPDIVLRAMHAGIRDIVSPEIEVNELRVLLERACLAAASRRRGMQPAAESGQDRGRVIAVMSPKGGVGKTTVATNLAVGLGAVAPMGVVIVDLDLQFGDVASGLLLEPEHSITEAVHGPAAQDSMVLKAFLTVHPAGIYALCAPRKPSESDYITAEHVTRLINQLATEFKYVVVDTAPGLGEHCLATLELATDGVWVCGMDVPSIRGLRKSFSVLKELQLLPQGRHTVLNFADRKSGLSVQDVEATIGVPIDTVIPRSRNLPFSTNRGVPVLQGNTRDAAFKGLKKLVERFDPRLAAAPQNKLHRRVVVS
ncbi:MULTISPECIES: AAA family ATPase [Paenarthrobacter]|uniref:AAA family ATPase n=1 Tax=Paenarthrobacter ureafaciens TaxID=37931 RepID=A0AAX3EEH2_PAEUR|nr:MULTISPECIES: AAA family ATPase [Paenarthrobacter]NKR10049.1 pilus assembly protein CpaE [Arthrobacter sp. M5]NKR14648.1 pilus assembly protein CpaE [Arthrobacter sp. M6]OEH60206.1 pilus assembly protein CpaE [Arthrobacter sp. D4]OEH60821.1 pilus assembly protein CpaE [Arthrobacter sp. D2]BCW85147.1 transcriptional regulator [Arthrobacter sp. NicSoilE8]